MILPNTFTDGIRSSPTCSILTAYPLSIGFKSRLLSLIPAVNHEISISEIRSTSYVRTLIKLFHIRSFVIFIPLEDENSSALLSVLKLVAFCTRCSSIKIVHPDYRVESVRRLNILFDFFAFILASGKCLIASKTSSYEIANLLSQSRVIIPPNSPSTNSVLYLKTNLWFGIKAGGSVGHISGVVNGLFRSGFNPTFASAEPPVMVDSSVPFIHINPPSTFGVPYELNNYRFQNLFEKQLLRKLPDVPFSLIYQRLSAANYLGVRLSRKLSVPLIVEYNGSEVWVAENWGRGMKFRDLAASSELVLLKHAHLVVTVSDVLRSQLLDFGVDPSRIVCYPNCVDTSIYRSNLISDEKRAAFLKQYEIPSDTCLITFVGTFGPWHGADILAEAIIDIHVNHCSWLRTNPVHFLFVGDGSTLNAVKSSISNVNADYLCTFTGLVPQASTPFLLSVSDILVSPHVPNSDGSRFFGSPTKLFEYMSSEKPIIASRLEQISDILRPSTNFDISNISPPTSLTSSRDVAVTVPPGCVPDLVAAIKFLVENPSARTTLGSNARKLAEDRYSWDKHVSLILERAYNLDLI